MIKDIFYMIITGTIIALIGGILKYFIMFFITKNKKKNIFDEQEMNKEHGYIIYSKKIILLSSIISFSITLIMLYLLIKEVDKDKIAEVFFVSVLAFLALIGGLLLLLYYKNRKIFVDGDRIINQNIFLNQKPYNINQLNLREIDGGYGMVFIVYNDDGKKIFKIEEFTVKNSRILFDDIKKINADRVQKQLESGTYF